MRRPCLGNRSALEWVIDQYQVSTDKRSGIVSDPNREEDPQYIVRLVGHVIRVSIDTARIVKDLPATFEPPADRGREDRLTSVPPPSEPDGRISRIRLSG